jgi:hypothetical protein
MWSITDMRAMDMRAMPTVAFAAVMAASVALVVTLDPSEPVDGATDKSAEARSSVSYVGGAPRDVACSGQTWPYIERRCLVEAPPRLAERRASIQVGTIDARKVTAAAPDVGAAVAIDGSSAASDITASVPVAREAARSVSLENGEMQPAPIVVKKEKRSRRTPRQEQRPVSDEELAAAIEQDIAQPRAVASKRGRVVRSDRLEAAVRQLERMF